MAKLSESEMVVMRRALAAMKTSWRRVVPWEIRRINEFYDSRENNSELFNREPAHDEARHTLLGVVQSFKVNFPEVVLPDALVDLANFSMDDICLEALAKVPDLTDFSRTDLLDQFDVWRNAVDSWFETAEEELT
jgi:hypothetical protein